MNVLVTPLFQHVRVALAGALLVLILLVLAGAFGFDAAAHTTAHTDASPFRWA